MDLAAKDELARESASAARRTFLGRVSAWFMAGGLFASYGACAAMGARFLYPARERLRRWQFLVRAQDVAAGSSFVYRAPSGEGIAVARHGAQGTVEDFVALSSTCPHLGCQVHWEAQNTRFFCPCHNGAFDAEGRALAGPPFDAGQVLARYPLRIEEGLVFIEVPLESLSGPTQRRGG